MTSRVGETLLEEKGRNEAAYDNEILLKVFKPNPLRFS